MTGFERTNRIIYVRYPYIPGFKDHAEGEYLTREEMVEIYGELSVAAMEAILTQNPEITVGLNHVKYEILVEFEMQAVQS